MNVGRAWLEFESPMIGRRGGFPIPQPFLRGAQPEMGFGGLRKKFRQALVTTVCRCDVAFFEETPGQLV
jgi:hypothetical protein